MTLSTLLTVYILGGLTFLPLLVAAILIPAWLALPRVEQSQTNGTARAEHDDTAKEGEGVSLVLDDKGDGAASGTFAVLRKYDFQAATAALHLRSNAGTTASTISADGLSETHHSSESVYQSMYRSVFERNRSAASSTSILANEDQGQSDATARVRRPATPASVFYIVLRHGHLMLYDSSAQLEVRHVISLAHHDMSLSSGEGSKEAEMPDGDLFIKRTAIVLTPRINQEKSHGVSAELVPPPKKPFYLFSPTCVEKEDFYHALLCSRNTPPVPLPLETNAMIKLQSTLHSTNSLTVETRALNSIVSRLFLALYRTDRVKDIIRSRIEKKIARVQKPAFLAALTVKSIDLGNAAPIISNPRPKDLNISGDMTLGFDVRYSGAMKVTVSALAKLDLGPRFKTRTADLLLSTCLSRLQGQTLIRIKPPPSNRFWFCFESIPDMEIKVEPIVQSRQITYTFILRGIEERIRSVVAETLVKPNWDDIPFFDTRDQHVRGGIWKDEGFGEKDGMSMENEGDNHVLGSNEEKVKSVSSVLASGSGVEGDSSAASSGSEATTKIATDAVNIPKAELKRRSVASLPATRKTSTPPPSMSRPSRTPSFTSPSASVASVQLDDSSASSHPARSETEPQPQSQKRWRLRPAAVQPEKRKSAIETMREMRDQGMPTTDVEDELGRAPASDLEDTDHSDSHGQTNLPTDASSTHHPARTPTGSSNMTSTSSASTQSQRQQEAVQKGKTFLAGAAAATNAAKSWGWNAIQNRGRGRPGGVDQNQEGPIGRGQPLPPPGTPLPGPQRGWLPTGIGRGSVKRKPVPPLPPRRDTAASSQVVGDNTDEQGREVISAAYDTQEAKGNDVGSNLIASPTSDDFGPWRENSGAGLEDLEHRGGNEIPEMRTAEDDHNMPEVQEPISPAAISDDELSEHQITDIEASSPQRKKPPPLPARPQAPDTATARSVVDEESTTTLAEPGETESPQSDVDEPNETDFHDEEDGMINNVETENLVAIPAPVNHDVDEGELEANGVQEALDAESVVLDSNDLSRSVATGR